MPARNPPPTQPDASARLPSAAGQAASPASSPQPTEPRTPTLAVVVASLLSALALVALGGAGAWLVQGLGSGGADITSPERFWPFVTLVVAGWVALGLAWSVLRSALAPTRQHATDRRSDAPRSSPAERVAVPAVEARHMTAPPGLAHTYPPALALAPASAAATSSGAEPVSALGHPLFTPVVLRLADALPGRSLLVRRDQLDSPWLLVHVHAAGAGSAGGTATSGMPAKAAPTPSTQAGALDSAAELAAEARTRANTALAPPYPLLGHWLADHHEWPADAVLGALGGDASGGAGQAATVRVLPLDARAAIVWIDPAEVVAQLAEKERESFVYTVSHDLRAPIRVIEGFTRIIKEDHGPALDRIGNDHLDRVLGAAARMTSMIDALLTLSRLSTRQLACEPVDLSAMAAQVMDELQRQAPERQAEAIISPGLVVDGDAALLRSVLDNLLGNAWKYSARRDVTRIEFGLLPDAGDSHAGQRVFCVRDNGAGFDMRFADRLFGPFQRLHSASEFAGTGVGLASVRRIVRRHGGEVWAEARVDQGASFYFTLA
ncbi:MAG: hypothetical protein IPG93_13285 [Burkholderiales bacterium]|nr:hypothetical protein [Burkholderiales bacterium]